MDSHDLPGGAQPSSSSRRRGVTHHSCNTQDDGRKIKLSINEFGQPNDGNADGTTFSSAIGVLARAHIPITYKTFTDVPPEYIQRIISTLEEKFEFENVGGVDGAYVRNRINAAWRNHKYRLYMSRVKDKDPIVAREGPAPTQVPIDDWRIFVDYCNSEEFKATSTKNAANRSKQAAPYTLGRKSMAVTRHEMVCKY